MLGLRRSGPSGCGAQITGTGRSGTPLPISLPPPPSFSRASGRGGVCLTYHWPPQPPKRNQSTLRRVEFFCHYCFRLPLPRSLAHSRTRSLTHSLSHRGVGLFSTVSLFSAKASFSQEGKHCDPGGERTDARACAFPTSHELHDQYWEVPPHLRQAIDKDDGAKMAGRAMYKDDGAKIRPQR